MTKDPVAPEIAALSFEDAIAQLEAIVRDLEAGNRSLEDSIEAYSRGAQLKAHCEAKLREAQDRVERIAKAADGSVTAIPAGIE